MKRNGFTLLEVMVALAILSSSVVVLLEIVTNNVRATNHAKLMTAATLLARGRMVAVEQEILEKGFGGDLEMEASGDFDEQGFRDYRWTTLIEKVELPTDMIQKEQQEATAEASKSDNPMEVMTGFLGGMMGAFIEPVRVGLEESVRKVTLKVFWNEVGRGEQSLELQTYLTDPSRLELAMGIPAGGLPGAGGQTPPGQTPGGPPPGRTQPGRPPGRTPPVRP